MILQIKNKRKYLTLNEIYKVNNKYIRLLSNKKERDCMLALIGGIVVIIVILKFVGIF